MNTSPDSSGKVREGKSTAHRPAVAKISARTIGRLTEVLKLLADESRLKILLALAREGEMHVSALCALLKQSQPAVSHHLTLLRLPGLIAFRRDGKHNYYRLQTGRLRELLELVFADRGNGERQIQFEDFTLAYRRKK